MEPKISLPCSQELASGLNPEPGAFSKWSKLEKNELKFLNEIKWPITSSQYYVNP